MSRPPLAAFLDDPAEEPASGTTPNADQDSVEATYHRLVGIVEAVIEARGVDTVAATTDLDRGRIAAIVAREGSKTAAEDGSITLETVATILATESSFSATEVRARIRDQLVLQMSRRPIDVASLSAQYGFDDAATLRAKIEGERHLSLREYARLRVALFSPG